MSTCPILKKSLRISFCTASSWHNVQERNNCIENPACKEIQKKIEATVNDFFQTDRTSIGACQRYIACVNSN
jgi:hypothetical protein